MVDGPADGVGECGRGGVLNEEACFFGDDRLECSASRIGDNRPATRLGFEGHDTEILLAGQQDHARTLVEGSNLVIRTPAQEFDVGARLSLEAGAIGPGADNLQWHVGKPAGVNGQINAFIGDERRHHKSISLGSRRIGPEKLSIDRRIYHSRLAIIVSADSARNMLRIRDISVHAP